MAIVVALVAGTAFGYRYLTERDGADAAASESVSGTVSLVTSCGRPPQLEARGVSIDDGALVVTMRITASCADGDVLSSNGFRLALASGTDNIAAATFDLSRRPIAVPRPGAGSGHVEREFRFPLGSFWRIPDSAIGTSSTAASERWQSALRVEFDDVGESARDSATTGVGSEPPVDAVSLARPVSGDAESASLDALRAQANTDRPVVVRDLADRWIPQLSSKRPGMVADGITWDNAETLREHLSLRLRYPEVRLLRSGDWSTFSYEDYWVTVAGVTYPDPQGALGWCAAKGLDRDHCYAKLVSATHPEEGSTVLQR